MRTANLLEAKTNLSKLIAAIERGAENKIVIAAYSDTVILV